MTVLCGSLHPAGAVSPRQAGEGGDSPRAELEINYSVLSVRWPGEEKQDSIVWNVHQQFMEQWPGFPGKTNMYPTPCFFASQRRIDDITQGLDF